MGGSAVPPLLHDQLNRNSTRFLLQRILCDSLRFPFDLTTSWRLLGPSYERVGVLLAFFSILRHSSAFFGFPRHSLTSTGILECFQAFFGVPENVARCYLPRFERFFSLFQDIFSARRWIIASGRFPRSSIAARSPPRYYFGDARSEEFGHLLVFEGVRQRWWRWWRRWWW